MYPAWSALSGACLYVLGITDTLRVDLCLRAHVLSSIRSLNSQLADEDRIRVHLFDLDSPLSAIHLHLQRLHSELGPSVASITLPTPEELRAWTRDTSGQQLVQQLLEELEETAGERDALLAELGTAVGELWERALFPACLEPVGQEHLARDRRGGERGQ